MADEPRQSVADDERLVTAALGGDVPSFGVLVERYWKMVFALAISRVRDAAEAEDIAQESFLKAHSQLHTLRDPSRFAGWLGRITIQQCSNAIRRNVRLKAAMNREAAEPADREAVGVYSSNPGLTEQQIRFVRETIGNLPNKLQELIIMRFTTGLSAVEIAEQLDKRPGTVRVWLHRAYKILRKDLAPLLEEVEP
ncbi:MAG: RNA polymerase sigma factor [Phycisphaerales bacterium]